MKKDKNMKKILVVALLAFVLIGVKANAQQDEKNNLKATDIKIHKKQAISDEERKSLDEIAKGKSGGAGSDKSLPILASGALGQQLPVDGTKYAIVIGLANYNGTANDLCSAAAKTDASDSAAFPITNPQYYCQDYDSIHMKDVLVNQYGYDLANIIILRDGQATKAGILDAMNVIKSKSTGNDEVAFFYSGHGVSGNYYGGIDSEKVDEAMYTYDGNFVWDDDLKQWADGINAYREVFVFDMCLAGGMKDIMGPNRVVAMSSAETQSSFTYTLGGVALTNGYAFSEGLFSHNFVINGMANKLADGSNLLFRKDTKVAVEEAFGYTYPIVKIKQSPVLNDQYVEDLVLGY